jgi:hypothetical protein
VVHWPLDQSTLRATVRTELNDMRVRRVASKADKDCLQINRGEGVTAVRGNEPKLQSIERWVILHQMEDYPPPNG